MRAWLIVGTLICSAALSGCLGSSPFSALNRQNAEGEGIHLDPDLGPNESGKVSSDLELLSALDFDGGKIRYFSGIFGGGSAENVRQYLSARVHWILSSRKNVDQAVVMLDRLASSAQSPQVVASNIGAAIWFSMLASDAPAAGIQIGNSLIEIHSTRAGVIQLGEGYSSDQATPLLRLSTLVHEARHSDCTGGVSRRDLRFVKEGKDPPRKDCGHLHVDCPPGHPYAGYPACDDHAWGAYAVEADFMAAVSRSCASCSAQEKQIATTIFADAASRVLNIDELLTGRLGDPDMSSSSEVRP